MLSRLGTDQELECDRCSEELTMCQDAFKHSYPPEVNKEATFFKKILSFLFPEEIVFKPVIVYLSTFVIIFATYFITSDILEGPRDQVTFNLISAEVRGGRHQNEIMIQEKQNLIELEFSLPTIENNYYNINLLSQSNDTIMTWYHIKHQIPFALDIPTTYLYKGQFSMLVSNESDVEEYYTITFSVSFQE